MKLYSDPWSLFLVPQVGAVRGLAECPLLCQGKFCDDLDAPLPPLPPLMKPLLPDPLKEEGNVSFPGK